ncbi:MAG: Endonuclease V [Methanonatronarchaeales archaeon]|nr:Endonuclease V [Methanonatronarchaeales archaeon]
MEPSLPDPSTWTHLTKEGLYRLQEEVAERATFDDEGGDVERVAGVDQAFPGDLVLSCVVSMEGEDVVERSAAEGETPMPYVPGLLVFREMPTAMAAVESLDDEPDALLVDGSGAIHPRFAGLATHLGVALDLPTVGVIKNLLCGETEEPTEVGEANPVLYEGRLVGYSFLSKERCNPVYVSPGHRFSPEGALDLVREWLTGHKLPEPIFLADRCVDEYGAGSRQPPPG